MRVEGDGKEEIGEDGEEDEAKEMKREGERRRRDWGKEME